MDGLTYTLAYDEENRIETVTDTAASQTWTFHYDGNGTRVRQVNPDGSQLLLLNGGRYHVEIAADSSVSTTRYYSIAGQRPAMRNNDGSINYLLGDHLGSVSTVVDASGQIISQSRYLPFGEVLWEDGASPTDYTYTGQRSLSDIGLMDYNARFYDPMLGRFTSPDSIVPDPGSVIGYNRYAYVANNPMIYTDPSGHRIEESYNAGYGGSYIAKDPVSSTNWKKFVSNETYFLRGEEKLIFAETLPFVYDDAENDAMFLVDIYKSNQLPGKSAKDRTNFLLSATAENNYTNFAGIYGDSGFKPEYQDGYDQIGHFLTAIRFGQRIESKTLLESYIFKSAIIGHEMISDNFIGDWSPFLQTVVGFNPTMHFMFAMDNDKLDELIVKSYDYLDNERKGNSVEDLELTRFGLNFWNEISVNNLSNQEASQYLLDNLCE